MPANKELQTSFTFPERLTLALYDIYERELRVCLKATEALGELTGTRQIAIVFQSAVKAGLFRNWQSMILPNPDSDDLDNEEASIILWAGELMADWIAENRHLPKVTLWQRLTMLWALWTKRKIQSPPRRTYSGR